MTDSGACSVWDPGKCDGTPACPPRCPRFFDRQGTPLLVRPYESGDFEGLVELYATLDEATQTMGIPPDRRGRIRRWLDDLIEKGRHLLARDDRVVGHVCFAPTDTPDPELLVFLDDGYHGRGIGDELVRQAIAHAAHGEYESLTLTVSKENRRAISLFRSFGFSVVERNPADFEMSLSLEAPIAETVRRPPAER